MKKRINKNNVYDKLFTAIVFAIVIIATVALFPLIFLFRGGEPLFIYNYYSMLFIKLIGVIAFIVGFILPIDKVYTLLGHFWLTEKQPRIGITLMTWGICFAIGYTTHYFITR